MGGVDVFKSPSADMIEGGISGTVNLRTRLPFDSKKRILSLSIEDSYGDFVKKWAPTYSLLYSDTLRHRGRRVRPAGQLHRLQAVDPRDGTQASNFGCRTNLGAALGLRQWHEGRVVPARRGLPQHHHRPRAQGPGGRRPVAQQRPHHAGHGPVPALGLQPGLDRARDRDRHRQRHQQRRLAPVAGTSVHVRRRGVFTNGVITGTTGWRGDQNGPQPRTPADGLQSNNVRRDVDQTYITTDWGANFKWTPNEHWGVQGRLPARLVQGEGLDVGLWASTFQNLQMS
jgi:hypothetical protein